MFTTLLLFLTIITTAIILRRLHLRICALEDRATLAQLGYNSNVVVDAAWTTNTEEEPKQPWQL